MLSLSPPPFFLTDLIQNLQSVSELPVTTEATATEEAAAASATEAAAVTTADASKVAADDVGRRRDWYLRRRQLRHLRQVKSSECLRNRSSTGSLFGKEKERDVTKKEEEVVEEEAKAKAKLTTQSSVSSSEESGGGVLDELQLRWV